MFLRPTESPKAYILKEIRGVPYSSEVDYVTFYRELNDIVKRYKLWKLINFNRLNT